LVGAPKMLLWKKLVLDTMVFSIYARLRTYMAMGQLLGRGVWKKSSTPFFMLNFSKK
jgi:hypothetical protein